MPLPACRRNAAAGVTGPAPAVALLLGLAVPAWAQSDGAADGAGTMLQAVTVSSARQAGADYGTDRASSATKTDTPLLSTPQSVQVVTRELLDDQAAVKLEDALRNVAGVMPGGYYGSYDYFRIRGFDASGYTYLDGLSVSRGTVKLNRELFGLERLEVVKGPASTLYGAGSPGGLVDLVSKRPQQANFVQTQFSAGSFGYYEPALDANAVLSADRSLYGRFNFLYRSQDSFTDFAHQNRLFAATALTWEPGRDTRLTLLASYQRDDNHLGFPLPAVGTILYNPNGQIPASRYIGEPAQPMHIQEWAANAGYQLDHRIDGIWSLRQNLRYTWDCYDWDDVLYPGGLSSDLRSLYRNPYFRSGRFGTFGVDNTALADFELARMRHRLALGVDYYYEVDQAAGIFVSTADGLPLDLFAPQYGAALPQRPDNLGPLQVNNTRQLGFYVQDQVELVPAVTLTLGAREDRASTEASGAGQTPHHFSPRTGVNWEFVDGVAVYASYSQSFLPQAATLASGTPAQPETGRSLEAGLKGDLHRGRLRFTAAAYQIKRQNVVSSIASDPTHVTQSGEQRSRGFELDTALRLLAGWELTAAYAYTDASVQSDLNAAAVGRPLRGVPRNSASLWSRYTLQDGRLRGLGFGLGGNYYTRQAGCDPTLLGAACELPVDAQGQSLYGDSFDLPSYFLLNAALYYERGPLRAQLNGSNLLDRSYYSGSYDALYVSPGTPRSLLGTLSYRW